MITDEVPSRQEMFNRAWRGLKGQGWALSTFKPIGPGDPGSGCSYDGPNGRKCAWGWVDPVGTADRPDGQIGGTVRRLRELGIGIAAKLSEDEIAFACELQRVHDQTPNQQASMEDRMRTFAAQYNLSVPGDE